MKQVVLFVHGIGQQNSGYSLNSKKAILEHLKANLSPPSFLALESNLIFKEVLYSRVLGHHQDALWERVKHGNGIRKLDQVDLRQFMISFAGDAIAYANDGKGKAIYQNIQACFVSTLDELKATHPEGFELTVIAHSLGTVVASDWIYDQKIKIHNFFTLGSPIALWLLRRGDLTQADRPVEVDQNGVWINILDDDDVIAYPLRNINEHYRKSVHMDYITNIGNVLQSWNLSSHMYYWNDGNVVQPISDKILLDFQCQQGKAVFNLKAYLKSIEQLWDL